MTLSELSAGLLLHKNFSEHQKPSKFRTFITYQDIFQLVYPISTTNVHKNEVLKTYEIDIYLFTGQGRQSPLTGAYNTWHVYPDTYKKYMIYLFVELF